MKVSDAVPTIVDRTEEVWISSTQLSQDTTWGIDEVVVPKQKQQLLKRLVEKKREVLAFFNEGLISRDERRRMIIEIWHRAKTELKRYFQRHLM